MKNRSIYISHDSALHYWRTNPPWYVLEGADRNIRTLRSCPKSDDQIREFKLSEDEFGPKPIDVLVPVGAPRPRSFLNYHVQKTRIPPRSLYPIRDGIHVVSPSLCFVQLCKKLSIAEAFELGMELCGTYALRPDTIEGMSSRDYQLVNASLLNRRLQAWESVHGLARARMVAPYLVNGSASPMESKVFLLLCLPQKYGGYNIEKPELNPEVELPRECQLILRQEKVKPDMLWRSIPLVVEYDGEYHNDPAQSRKDSKRRAVLEMMGYTVLTVKKQQVYDPVAFDGFAKAVAQKHGKRIRPLTTKQQLSRELLRVGLSLTQAP